MTKKFNKQIIIATITALVALTFTSCGLFANSIQGNGEITTETFNITDSTIYKLDLDYVTGDMEIFTGSKVSVEITTDSNILTEIKVSGGDGVLKIASNSKSNFLPTNFIPTKGIKYKVTIPSLSSIKATSASEVTVESEDLNSDTLTLSLSGASKLKATSLELGELEVKMSGASDLDIMGGSVDFQTIKLSGASTYNSKNISGKSASVNISGASKISLNVSESVTGKVSGASSVYLYGFPSNSISVSGASNVNYLK